MNLEKIKELAIKYGVPMPETCKEMNPKSTEEHNFYWVKSVQGNYYLCYPFWHYDNLYFREPETDVIVGIWDAFYFAPQMHEIIKLLPKVVSASIGGYDYYCLGMHSNPDGVTKVNYTEYLGKSEIFSIVVSDFNFAEAYAQMYLAMKKEGLL